MSLVRFNPFENNRNTTNITYLVSGISHHVTICVFVYIYIYTCNPLVFTGTFCAKDGWQSLQRHCKSSHLWSLHVFWAQLANDWGELNTTLVKKTMVQGEWLAYGLGFGNALVRIRLVPKTPKAPKSMIQGHLQKYLIGASFFYVFDEYLRFAWPELHVKHAPCHCRWKQTLVNQELGFSLPNLGSVGSGAAKSPGQGSQLTCWFSLAIFLGFMWSSSC